MCTLLSDGITPSIRLQSFVFVLLALFNLAPEPARAENQSLAVKLKARQQLRTPVNDELLHELEQDFVDLLQQSDSR